MNKLFGLKVLLTVDLWSAALLITSLILDYAIELEWTKNMVFTLAMTMCALSFILVIYMVVYFANINHLAKKEKN